MKKSNASNSAGLRFREALKKEKPLQIVGAINAQHALLAEQAGFNAIYLSGGGVAAGSLGIPDLGITTLEDVLVDIWRITNVCDLPLMVDVDTGFGPSAFNVARTVKSLIKAGAAALHIEDQVGAKRCGHRPGKEVVSKEEMSDRLKAAVDARTEEHFVIGARTDAFASEGLDKTLERAVAYKEAGADCFYPIFLKEANAIQTLMKEVGLPVNVLMVPGIPSFAVLQQAGASRISLGPGFLKKAIAALKESAEKLLRYEDMEGIINNPVTTAYLKHLIVK